MLPEGVSISWTEEAGTEASEAFTSANDAPVIYRRGNEGARCTISLRIPEASQAIVVSNARSCEFYELDALGRQDYQGYCQGVSQGPGRWELTVAGKGGTQSFKLVLCGLSPADQLKLWDTSIMRIVRPVAPRPHHTKDATPLTSGASGQAQMEGIREILRQGTGMHAVADPKRRFMHALANAALEQNDKDNTKQMEKDQGLSAYLETLGVNSEASAAAKKQEAQANGHDSIAGSSAGNDQQKHCEPSLHSKGRAQMDSQHFEESIEGILQRQLGWFAQGLASMCDAALARFSEQLDTKMIHYEARMRPGNVSESKQEGT